MKIDNVEIWINFSNAHGFRLKRREWAFETGASPAHAIAQINDIVLEAVTELFGAHAVAEYVEGVRDELDAEVRDVARRISTNLIWRMTPLGDPDA